MTSELFRFARGSEVFGFVDSTESVVFGGLVYAPAPIRRATIEQTQEVARADLAVDVLRDNPVALLFQAGAPVTPVTLTIYRGDAITGGYAGLWIGFVQSAGFSSATATLTCAPVMSVLRRNAPRQRYSQGCRFALFGSACGVDKSTYADTVTVVSITNRLMILSGIDATREIGYFRGGYLELGAGRELIVGSDATFMVLLSRRVQIELARPIPGAIPGASGTIFAGCNHQQSHCAAKFSNIERYGGFLTLPTRLEE